MKFQNYKAKDVGLQVLLRIGPWDHGECRNGGHPDWLLKKVVTHGSHYKYLSVNEKRFIFVHISTTSIAYFDGLISFVYSQIS